MEMMQKHLQLISDATPKVRYAIVIMDCASWHSHKVAIKFDNLCIMHLPLYSPELNPIEQVSQGWNNFRHQIELVKTLCQRKWENLIT
jgi:transposase